MKFVFPLALSVAFIISSRAASYTNAPDADAFVRAAPGTTNLNYGAAGALSVSGPTATNALGVTNGIYDTFIRYNTAALVTNFNALFGPGNWVVTHATLQVTEQGTPNNNIFNRGAGSFQIRWIADTNWTEGTGTPMNLTTDGICYTNESGLLNSNTDMNLGTFTNSGMTMTLFFPLSLPAGFVNAVTAGGEVDFYLTALTPGIGFTFNSRQFGTQSQWPLLEIPLSRSPALSASACPARTLSSPVRTALSAKPALVLASTNLALPLNQWPPVATNQLGASGNFSVTVTDAAGPAAPPETFFILQAQ